MVPSLNRVSAIIIYNYSYSVLFRYNLHGRLYLCTGCSLATLTTTALPKAADKGKKDQHSRGAQVLVPATLSRNLRLQSLRGLMYRQSVFVNSVSGSVSDDAKVAQTLRSIRSRFETADVAKSFMLLVKPVSYTHLDVYKRQGVGSSSLTCSAGRSVRPNPITVGNRLTGYCRNGQMFWPHRWKPSPVYNNDSLTDKALTTVLCQKNVLDLGPGAGRCV